MPYIFENNTEKIYATYGEKHSGAHEQQRHE